MSKRELEFSDGKSEKFWKIELQGDSHTVNYGRMGTAGQTKTKEFASAQEAQKSYDKLVAQKLKKGYADAGGGVAVAVKTEAPPAEEAPAAGRRELEYQDAKSHKFWRIELDGSSHTVCYGKVGTDGQSKTKSFDDEAQAQKSFDKLVSQKLKKGYADVAGAKPAATPAKPSAATAKPAAAPAQPAAEKAPAKTNKAKKKAPPADPAQCTLKLPPEAMFWARWRQQEPPKPLKFDPEKVWKAKKRYAFRDWTRKKMFCLSFEEALFWLVDQDAHNQDGQHMAVWESLKAKFTYPLTPSQFDDAIEAAKEREKVPYKLAEVTRGGWPQEFRWAVARALMKAQDWFHRFLDRGPNRSIYTRDIYQTIPFFTPEEKEFARGKIRELGALADNVKYWPTAAALGMTDEIRDMLDNWSGDQPPSAGSFLYVALEDPKEVYERLKNSGVSPWGGDRQYAFDLVELPYLAHTEDWGLDLLMPEMLNKQTKKDAKLRFEALAAVQSPRTVTCMLDVIEKTEIPELAHKWLLKHHAFTLPELFRLCQDDDYKEAAQEVIRRIGLDKPEVVEAALSQASDEVRALVQGAAPASPAAPRPTLEPLPKVEVPPLTEGSIPFVRKINIYEEDWYAATWRRREPLQRNPIPFDKAACAEKIRRLYSQTIGAEYTISRYNSNQRRHYSESVFDWPHGHPSELSQEEAQFWAHVILSHPNARVKNEPPSMQQILDALDAWDPKSLKPTADGMRERMRVEHRVMHMPSDLPPVLTALLSPKEYLDLWLVGGPDTNTEAPLCRTEIWHRSHVIGCWFRWGYVPYLSDSERTDLAKYVRSHVEAHPKLRWDEERIALVAQALGLPECQESIDSGLNLAHKLIFGVQSKEALVAARQKTDVSVSQHEDLRFWLAHLEYEGFDEVEKMLGKHHEDLLSMRKGYYESGWAEMSQTTDFNSLWSWISTSPSPEMATIMARLDSKQKPDAKRDDTFSDWLRHNPECTVPALVHMAIGEDAYATYAVNALRAYHLTHGADEVRAHMSGYEAGVQRVLERKLFEPYAERGEESFEEWLCCSEMFVEPPKKQLKWINVAKLPAVTVEGHTFHSSQLEMLLYALMASTPEAPHPHVTNLRLLGASESFDEFTWHLFELWIAEGGPPKQSWAMEAWGHLASEKIAHKVFPLMKKWPGDKKHKWSLAGLASLQAMGTDGALSLVNSLATKLKFKGLKEAAGYVMNRIAKARGLSREEFADRVIPDCGLDERGERVFDFGARKFSVVIDGNLKVQVRDEEGRVKKSLPKAGAKDDAALSKAAAADFKMVKSQVSDMAKIQPGRLESALRGRRFWRAADLEKFFVRHPFMSHLAKRLVWGVYEDGVLENAFRVTESFDFANDQDDEFKLGADQTVGLMHPLELTQEQLKTWQSLFADYEIIQPFAQLDRPVYSVDDLAELKTVYSEFVGGNYPAISVKNTLERQGWKPEEDSYICYHRLACEDDLTVQVDWKDGYHVTMVMEEELEAESLRFMRGGKELDLEDVDPMILSEVFLTLSSLPKVAAK